MMEREDRARRLRRGQKRSGRDDDQVLERHPLLDLQSRVGNQAVLRMLEDEQRGPVSHDGDVIHRFWDVALFKEKTREKGAGKSTAQKQIERLLEEYSSLEEKGVIPDSELRRAQGLIEKMMMAAKGWLMNHKSKTDDTKITKSREQRGAGMQEFLTALDKEWDALHSRLHPQKQEDVPGEEDRSLPIFGRDQLGFDDAPTSEREPEPDTRPWQDQLRVALYENGDRIKWTTEEWSMLWDAIGGRLGRVQEPEPPRFLLVLDDDDTLFGLEYSPEPEPEPEPEPSGEQTEDTSWQAKLRVALEAEGLDTASAWEPGQWERLQGALGGT